MDKIKDGKYFTKLDIWWGYNNVWIKEGDEWKAAFKTNRGLYEPTVMFFRMCNSPATFQAMMDNIFEDLIEEGIVIIYMDDMFLSAKMKEQLRENTKWVLQWLMENNLYLKPKKCEFCKEKIEWLGMVIQEGKITMDPGKLKGIQDWLAPTTVKQVRGFLGFGNFYQRFIWGFSEIAWPLNELLKKGQEIQMDNWMSTGVWRFKNSFYQRTRTCDARSDEAIPNQVWRVKICIRSHPNPARFQWGLTPVCVHFKNVFPSRKKL